MQLPLFPILADLLVRKLQFSGHTAPSQERSCTLAHHAVVGAQSAVQSRAIDVASGSLFDSMRR